MEGRVVVRVAVCRRDTGLCVCPSRCMDGGVVNSWCMNDGVVNLWCMVHGWWCGEFMVHRWGCDKFMVHGAWMGAW